MNPRKVLGLPSGLFDRAALKSAYARELRLHRPTEDPEGFRRVRDAYETLSAWLDRTEALAASARLDPWDREAGDEEEQEEAADGDVAPAPPSPPADGPELASRRGVRWPPTPPPVPPAPPAALAPSIPWTAELLLASWLRGEVSLALDGVAALEREGQVEEVESLAQRLLEAPAARERADFPAFAITVARASVLVQRDLAQTLADQAWRQMTPSARQRLNLYAFDLRRQAARHVEPWPIAAKRALLQVAAGVACPPPPRPHDWEEALTRLRGLPSDSPTLAWLAAEAPHVLRAAGARPPRRTPKRPRARNATRLIILFLVAPVIMAVITRFSGSRSGSGAAPDLTLPESRWLRGADQWDLPGVLSSRDTWILEALERLDTGAPRTDVEVRSGLTSLEENPAFWARFERSSVVRDRYTAIRLKYLPSDAWPAKAQEGARGR